jgi:hypothetical protein
LDDGDNMAPEPTATTGGGEGQGAGAAEEAVAPAGAGDEDERDRGGGGGGKLLQVRKRSSLSPTFMLNRLLILPRQARDKHRESTQKQTFLLPSCRAVTSTTGTAGGSGCRRMSRARSVALASSRHRQDLLVQMLRLLGGATRTRTGKTATAFAIQFSHSLR